MTSLGQQTIRVMRHVWDRLRGRPVARLPWPTSITTLLALYSVLSFAFWGYFIWILSLRLWGEAIHYPSVISRAACDLLYAPSLLAVDDPPFLTATFLLCITALMGYRIVRSLVFPILTWAWQHLHSQIIPSHQKCR
ncbi:MAG: hypothetical protein MI924_35260 [Chloroflexales bacterium]|nr:hypothetical protein [Chloroflexales bacterium]